MQYLLVYSLVTLSTNRDGDPWSGHIGFPGGRRESDDADDLSCAIRETREELGINLDNSEYYELLGRLDDATIPVTRAGRKRGVLSAFVFLEKPPVADGHDIPVDGAPELVLDPAEVAAVLWVPVSSLFADSPARVEHVFDVKPQHLGAVRVLPPVVLRLLGMHRALYTAVDVFGASTEIIDTEDIGSERTADVADGNGLSESAGIGKVIPAGKTPVLWGLSMRAVSDMVSILGGKRMDRPPFVFDNRILAAVHRLVFFVVRRISFLRTPPFRRRRCVTAT